MPTPRVVVAGSIVRVLQGYPLDARARHAVVTTAEGIARASNEDPLFPDTENGAAATAAILVAIAWLRSRVDPYSQDGAFVGLFRMRPTETPRITVNALLLPGSASRFAVDLVRQGTMASGGEKPASERFAFFDTWGRLADPYAPDARALRFSRDVHAAVTSRIYPRLANEIVLRRLLHMNVRRPASPTLPPSRVLRLPPHVERAS